MVEVNYGSVFMKMREKKGLSRKKVTKDIISVQALSNFERNSSGISLDRMIMIMKRCCISWQEFLDEAGCIGVESLFRFDCEITKLAAQNKLGELKRVSQQLLSYYETDYSIITLSLHLISKERYLRSVHQYYQLKEKELRPVFHYLDSLNYWGEFECYVFENLFHYFPEERYDLSVRRILLDLKKHPDLFMVKRYSPYQLLNRIVARYMEKKQFEMAYQVAKKIEDLIAPFASDTHFLFERILLRGQLGIACLPFDESALQEIRSCLQILELLGHYDAFISQIYRMTEQMIRDFGLQVEL